MKMKWSFIVTKKNTSYNPRSRVAQIVERLPWWSNLLIYIVEEEKNDYNQKINNHRSHSRYSSRQRRVLFYNKNLFFVRRLSHTKLH